MLQVNTQYVLINDLLYKQVTRIKNNKILSKSKSLVSDVDLLLLYDDNNELATQDIRISSLLAEREAQNA